MLGTSDEAIAKLVQQELATCANFVPLMGRLPIGPSPPAAVMGEAGEEQGEGAGAHATSAPADAAATGTVCNVAWSERDRRLHAWLNGQGAAGAVAGAGAQHAART